MVKSLFAILLTLANASRFLVMNDIHLDINSTSYEIPMTGEKCNIPLFKEMVQKAHAKCQEDKVELTAILIPGDFIEHGLAAWNDTIPNPNWPQMIETFQVVMQILSDEFPGVPILPGIGNNDCYYHDQAPSAENATNYYSEL